MAVVTLGLGVVTLVIAIVGGFVSASSYTVASMLLLITLIAGLVGILLSAISMRKYPDKKGMAVGGLVTSIIAVVWSVFSLFACVSCFSLIDKAGSNTSEVDSQDTDYSDNTTVNLADQMQVQEYSYINSIGDRIVLFYITNTSDKTVSISMNITAKDEAGNALAGSDASEYVVAPNSPVILKASLDGVDMNAQIDYSMNVSESYYQSATDYIDVSYNINGNKVVLTATNNGNSPAYFLEAQVIHLSNGEAVYYNNTYLSDSNNDFSIQPGETRTKDVTSWGKSFDDVIVTYTARTRF